MPINSVESHPDEVLMRRLRRGELRAFAELATRYWGAVCRIAANLLQNVSDADEVTEETFLRVLHSAESFRSDEPFRTSLYRLATSLSLMQVQSKSGNAAESADALLPKFDADGRLAAPQHDWSVLVETLTDRRDLAERIREALRRLHVIDRASFVLREIEQLPVEEVATILRTSPEMIRERAHRACLAMTGLLGRSFSPSPPLPCASSA